MNQDTGEIKRFTIEELKKDALSPVQFRPPWIEINEPNPKCETCKGKGTIEVDLTKDLNYGNRADRRKIPKGYTHKWIPCPDCAEIRGG
jgi:hypothetical protein